MNVTDRFLRYVAIDTTSDETSDTSPSTIGQRCLGNSLVDELHAIGCRNAIIDSYGHVYATIPANNDNPFSPAIGFIAHMDTSSEAPGKNIRPRIINNYAGGSIIQNEAHGLSLEPAEHPILKLYVGQDLICTDGTTLLGSDDKAGIAEIMCMAEALLQNDSLKHGTIKLAFTPDEEIGNGVNNFNLKKFGANYAYTVDGGQLGHIEYENFNAASAIVSIKGQAIHPGEAKHKMVNSIKLAIEFNTLLPIHAVPEDTEGYEGFFHLQSFDGHVQQSTLSYLIRDHDHDGFLHKKAAIAQAASFINKKYGPQTCCITITDSYYNMCQKITPHQHLITALQEAMLSTGIEPHIVPIRGGTDGARLSYLGLPCPNICTGGHNFHSVNEFIPIQSMEKVVAILIHTACSYADKKLLP